MSLVLHPADGVPVPWRNGHGVTRTLVSVEDADGVLWRVSIADLDSDALFSTFAGLDRLFVALGPLRLVVNGTAREMAAGDEAHFAGEAIVTVMVDEPTQALNVMTRGGNFRPRVRLRPIDGRVTPADVVVGLGALAAEILLLPVDSPRE